MSIIKIINYWDKQPCNVKHSKKKFLSKKYFSEVRQKRYKVEPHILKFANFKKLKNKNVLEIGCGIGTDGIEFIKNNANYVGIDVSKKSLDIFNKRIDVLNLRNKNPSIIEASAENLSFVPKKKYHLIYSFGVIHHTMNMKRAFSEIYKMAHKHTQIKIMLYAKNSYKNYMKDISNYRYEAQKGCPVVHKVDQCDVKNLIKNRFKVIKIYQDFIFPYQISSYKKNIYKKIRHFDVMPKKIFNRLSSKIGEHLLIELRKI